MLFSLMMWTCQQDKKANKTVETVIEKPYQPSYDVEFLLGQFDPKEHPDFVLIESKYASREGLMMQKKAYEAFVKMWEAARDTGIDLTILSATRNFDYQKGIWERKWFGKTLLEGTTDARTIEGEEDRATEILKYSAMPGTSRHHWGTDIDLNALNNQYFLSGEGQRIFEWLTAHAGDFGFCRPYTAKSSGRTGYEEEKWHWSYLPLSRVMTRDCEELFRDSLITGFEGSHTAEKLRIKLNYILGISEECR